MRRSVVLTLAVLFIALLLVLTIVDVARNGLSPLAVLSALILILFGTGIIGALRTPPRD